MPTSSGALQQAPTPESYKEKADIPIYYTSCSFMWANFEKSLQKYIFQLKKYMVFDFISKDFIQFKSAFLYWMQR